MKIANSNQSSSYKHDNSISINFYLVLLKSIYDIMVGSCRFSNYNFFLYSDFFLLKIMFLKEHDWLKNGIIIENTIKFR